MAHPRVDAVLVATPARSHFDLAKQALQAGKHVLVEKPLAMTTSGAEELIDLATQRNLTLMSGHTFLYSPPVLKIKELIDEDRIGPVLALDSTRVNLGIFRGDVDVIWDLGPHDISIAAFLFGSLPESVAAGGAAYMQDGILDTGYLHLRFPDRQTAHVVVSWLAPVKLRRTTIVGERGMILYDDTEEREKVKVFSAQSSYPSRTELQRHSGQLYRLGDVTVPTISSAEPLLAECADFVRCVRTGGTPVSSAQVGAQVVRILEGADRSVASGGRQVPLRRAGASTARRRT